MRIASLPYQSLRLPAQGRSSGKRQQTRGTPTRPVHETGPARRIWCWQRF